MIHITFEGLIFFGLGFGTAVYFPALAAKVKEKALKIINKAKSAS